MSDYYILDENRQPVKAESLEWAMWFEKRDRHVGNTTIGESQVSTVFLGLDHQWGDGPPLIFETMVFGGPMDQEQERYSTWEEAERGHADMVSRVTAVHNASFPDVQATP